MFILSDRNISAATAQGDGMGSLGMYYAVQKKLDSAWNAASRLGGGGFVKREVGSCLKQSNCYIL